MYVRSHGYIDRFTLIAASQSMLCVHRHTRAPFVIVKH